MNKPLTDIQINIIKLYEVDTNVVNDQTLLLARYWWAYDKWNPQDDLYTNLKKVTPTDAIKTARKWLHENKYIECSKEPDAAQDYQEHTNQYSNADAFAAMRSKVKEGKL